jgi:hypothetical protein
MTRAHRFAHRAVWPLLAVLVGLSFALALHLRPPPDAPPAAEEPRGAGAPP